MNLKQKIYIFYGICILNLLIFYFIATSDIPSSYTRVSLRRKTYKYIGKVLNNQSGGFNNTTISNSSYNSSNSGSMYSNSSSMYSNSSSMYSNSSNNNVNNSLPAAPTSAFVHTTVSVFDNSSTPQLQQEQHNIIVSQRSVRYSNDSKETQNITLPLCEDPFIEKSSPFRPNITLVSLDVVNGELGPLLEPGGAFQPKGCLARHHVAIVVPFRDRYAHLFVFLRNIHAFLMKQNIAYRIFIIEQTNGKPFNRAALMNIGFVEAMKVFKWDCFIFHDVDLLPLDNRNLYNCPRQPRHMSVAIDTLYFKLPYRKIFGGVSAMTREHFVAVNGYANSYFGWGGEDDDMSNRLRNANLFIARYPINIARYKMLKHQKERPNPKRWEILNNWKNKTGNDGLNSIKYDLYSYKFYPTYSWYYVELKVFPNNETRSTYKHYRKLVFFDKYKYNLYHKS